MDEIRKQAASRFYNTMYRIASIYFMLHLIVNVVAQKPEYLQMVKAESELEQLFGQLYSDTLSSSEPVNNRIREILPGVLALDGSMDFPWARLKQIGVIDSEDGKIRIFSWHVMDDPDNYRYFGYIQVRQKRDRVRVYELHDNEIRQRGLNKLSQSTDDWYGKLYYQIVTTRHQRRIYYTLLGLDYNNSRSNIKTVEAMLIQRQRPQFIGELFSDGKDKMDRMVFEYSSQVAISVRFDPGLDMITFDHIVPLHPIYERNFEFYGPDGSFDGLEFADGTWILREDIDARNLD